MLNICPIFDLFIYFVEKSKQCAWRRLKIKILGMSHQSGFSLGGTQSHHICYHATTLIKACEILHTSMIHT